jgi:hypothetical protein
VSGRPFPTVGHLHIGSVFQIPRHTQMARRLSDLEKAIKEFDQQIEVLTHARQKLIDLRPKPKTEKDAAGDGHGSGQLRPGA